MLREEDIAALTKSSGLNEVQVKESFDAFLAEHPNGKLKIKDFREMMVKAVPKKDAKKMEKHAGFPHHVRGSPGRGANQDILCV